MCNLPWSLIFVKETALNDNRPNGSMLLSCSASWTYSLEKRERVEKTQDQIPVFRVSDHLSIWTPVGLPFNFQSSTLVTDPRPIMQTAKMPPPHLPWSYSFKFSVFILLTWGCHILEGKCQLPTASCSSGRAWTKEHKGTWFWYESTRSHSWHRFQPNNTHTQTHARVCTHAQCLQCIMGPKPILVTWCYVFVT